MIAMYYQVRINIEDDEQLVPVTETDASVLVQDTGKTKKRKKKDQDIDNRSSSIIKTMEKIQGAIANMGEEDKDDEAMLFCKSLAPSLRRLSPESFAFTKLRFQEFLIGLEYPNLILNSDN